MCVRVRVHILYGIWICFCVGVGPSTCVHMLIVCACVCEGACLHVCVSTSVSVHVLVHQCVCVTTCSQADGGPKQGLLPG